jgi:uncharacterized protein YgiM (DUF1202 family)
MKNYTLALLSIFLLPIIIQCKSAPKKEEVPVVAPEPPKPEPVVEARALPEIKEVAMEVAVRPSLNLRSAAGLRGKIIGRIPYGKKLTIIDRLDDEDDSSVKGKKKKSKWYKVQYDGETGYVNSKYLREEGDDRIVRAPKQRVKRRRRAKKAAKKMTALKPEVVEPTQKKKP